MYNLNFDIRLLSHRVVTSVKDKHRCMLRFALVYGEWNQYHGNFKWKSLSTAAIHVGYKWKGEAHRALAGQYTFPYLDDKDIERFHYESFTPLPLNWRYFLRLNSGGTIEIGELVENAFCLFKRGI